MPLSIAVATAPTFEPVTLDEAKLHLRVLHAEEDELIRALIATAREQTEMFCARTWMKTTYTYKIDSFAECPENGWACQNGRWYLLIPRPPLQSVTIAYLDEDGASQTLATTVYGVDATSQPGRLYLKEDQDWPDTDDVPLAVTITAVSGYSSSSAEATQQAAVPARAKHANKLALANYYAHRESFVVGQSVNELPDMARSLLWGLRCVEV